MDNLREIQEVTWPTVREEVKRVNPELTKIIDSIDPDQKYKLIKVSYSFGDLIVDQGFLQLPDNQGKIYPVSSKHIDPHIQKQLAYSPIPLSLLLNKVSEVFIMDNERVIPLKVLEPGNLFGTFETLNFIFQIPSQPLWYVSAGSRIIFTLPKISESSGLKRLRLHYEIPADTSLRLLSEHWDLFKKIANHKNFNDPWQSQLILFTEKWFDFDKNDVRWLKFLRYLFEQGWLQSQRIIQKEQFGVFWQKYHRAITHRRLRPTLYLSDTFKHLLLIASGESPAFIPVQSNLVAPIRGLQKALLDIYQLKNNYIPTMMCTGLPNQKKHNLIYYSLSFPTLLEGSPESKNTSSTIMLDLRDIKLLMNTLLRDSSIEHSFLKKVTFDYFHVEDDIYNEIQSSKLIPKEDNRFADTTFPDLDFCSTSPFWRGCIRISFE